MTCTGIRRSLVIGLLVLSAGFWLLERAQKKSPEQRRTLIQTRTDLAYWFFTPLVTRFVTRLALGLTFLMFALWEGVSFDEMRQAALTRRTWASSLSAWIQVPLILLLADLLAYWSHRLFHGRLLWRFHAIHHSSKTVDWLSSVRLHPVNDIVSRIVQVLPLLDGIQRRDSRGIRSVPDALRPPPARECELDVRPVALRVCQSAFHRWHHTKEDQGLDKNFRSVSVYRCDLRHVLHAPGKSATALRNSQ